MWSAAACRRFGVGEGVGRNQRNVSSDLSAPPTPQRRQAAALHMAVTVTSRRRMRGVQIASLRRDAGRLLDQLAQHAELSVTLVADDEIRRLNRVYRHIDRATDVLAFAMREGDGADLHPQLLGDVVISLETAARQAASRGVLLADEVRMLLAHGILHLLGYDHERSPAEARRMFRRQRELLRALE